MVPVYDAEAAALVKSELARLRLSQIAVARELGLNSVAVSEWIGGRDTHAFTVATASVALTRWLVEAKKRPSPADVTVAVPVHDAEAAALVKAELARLRLSQIAVAQELGLNQVAVNHWIGGRKTRTPTVAAAGSALTQWLAEAKERPTPAAVAVAVPVYDAEAAALVKVELERLHLSQRAVAQELGLNQVAVNSWIGGHHTRTPAVAAAGSALTQWLAEAKERPTPAAAAVAVPVYDVEAAALVKAELARLRLSQTAVAQELGLNQAPVNHWIGGRKTRTPTVAAAGSALTQWLAEAKERPTPAAVAVPVYDAKAAALVKAELARLSLVQRAVARELGLNQVAVSQWISGRETRTPAVAAAGSALTQWLAGAKERLTPAAVAVVVPVYDAEVAALVKVELERLHLSQRAVAQELGLKRVAVNFWISGRETLTPAVAAAGSALTQWLAEAKERPTPAAAAVAVPVYDAEAAALVMAELARLRLGQRAVAQALGLRT